MQGWKIVLIISAGSITLLATTADIAIAADNNRIEEQRRRATNPPSAV